MKRRERWVIFVLVAFMATGAFAAHEFYGVVGNWNDPCMWTGDGEPDPAVSEIKFKEQAVCTLNTVENNFLFDAQRMRVYDGSTLNIEEGGFLGVTCWSRVGTGGTPGYVNQTGGTWEMRNGTDSGKIMVGDDPYGEPPEHISEYTISGGTLTYLDEEGANAQVFLGYEGGEGRLTVVGTDPTIYIRKLYVGGDTGSDYGVGHLKYQIGADGVSPITCTNNIYIAREGGNVTNVAHLELQLDAAPPAEADIVLAQDLGGGTIEGLGFATVTGASSGAEGALVTLSYGGTDYYYRLTYEYDAQSDGNNNDLALKWVPEPATLALLGFGLLAVRRRRK